MKQGPKISKCVQNAGPSGETTQRALESSGKARSAEIQASISVKGDYIYFHYMQDGFNDAGWGCAYRSLQTLFSWFLLNGYTTKPVPSIPDIQKLLVEIGDKQPKFIGRL
jgi:hypothetical protein